MVLTRNTKISNTRRGQTFERTAFLLETTRSRARERMRKLGQRERASESERSNAGENPDGLGKSQSSDWSALGRGRRIGFKKGSSGSRLHVQLTFERTGFAEETRRSKLGIVTRLTSNKNSYITREEITSPKLIETCVQTHTKCMITQLIIIQHQSHPTAEFRTH